MADWLTPKQLSEKRGIPETTLRCWKSLNYIASSTIDNVVMLDDESVTRFLNAHQASELGENCLQNIIHEKELEREMALTRLDDELFLIRTLELHQPLYHVLIGELGALITDERYRDIFLAISRGEPILRVAERYGLTYIEAIKTYSTILARLSKNTERFATLREQTKQCITGKFKTADPMCTPLVDIFEKRAWTILHDEAHIDTVRDLLLYTSEHGWEKLKGLWGMGDVTYKHILNTLCYTGFIVIDRHGEPELSPELTALLL